MNDLFPGNTGAIFSDCGKYRFRLWRIWDQAKPGICFIMLNPSTADEIKNDPTVERCERRARLWGYGRLDVVNLFAWRSTDPGVLRSVENPEGNPDNDSHISISASISRTVICAWGKHGSINERQRRMLTLLSEWNVNAYALRINADGTPAHPLYLPYDAQPINFLPH